MNKLTIDSVKINSVNSISLPIKEFKSGMNIICGSNEAGKSTMLSFLKNCFYDAKGMHGDIGLSVAGEKYLLKVKGDKDKNSCTIIEPIGRDAKDLISRINRDFYQKAFVINLDDINKGVDSSLFALIQDHNASKIAKYKEDIIKLLIKEKKLTANFGAGLSLKNILKEIKVLDGEILNLSKKENDYYDKVSRLQRVRQEIEGLEAKIQNKKLFQEIELLKKELLEVQEKLENSKIYYNDILYEKKQRFFDINKQTALIIKNIEELEKLSLSNKKIELEKKLLDISKDFNVNLSLEDIEQIDISRELETVLRDLDVSFKTTEQALKLQEGKKQDIQNLLSKLEPELEKMSEDIKNLDISDYSLYKEGVEELRAALLCGEDFKLKNNNLFKLILYILACLMFFGCAIFSKSLLVLVVGIVGVLICGFSLYSILKPEKNSINTVADYVRTDVLPKLNCEGKCLATPLLNAVLTNAESKLKQYEFLKQNYDLKFNELENVKNNYEIADNEFNKIKSSLEELVLKIEEKTVCINQKLSLDLFFEFINEIREIRNLSEELKLESEKKLNLEREIESYVKDFTEFLVETNLDSSINILALLEKTQNTLDLIEVNDKCRHEIDGYNRRIAELKQSIGDKNIEDLTPLNDLQELEAQLADLNIEYGGLNVEKKMFEDFEGLVKLRNERNFKESHLQELVKEVFETKLLLNIITHAEEQRRLAEPNLLSAEALLKIITGGRYVGANYATNTIVSNEGEIKTESQLSRGTREQLYLAFRLGYVQNYGSDGKSLKLPLIIDDAFVNFDKERLVNVLKTLQEFSKTNQVLFFTCHKEYITKLINTSDVNIVDM